MKRAKATKFLTGKIQLDLIPPFALEMLGMIYDWGSHKYAKHNWTKGHTWTTMIAAIKRHILEFEKGNDFDKESGLPHPMHAAWQCFTLYEHMRLHPELDDRFKTWGTVHKYDIKQYSLRDKICAKYKTK